MSTRDGEQVSPFVGLMRIAVVLAVVVLASAALFVLVSSRPSNIPIDNGAASGLVAAAPPAAIAAPPATPQTAAFSVATVESAHAAAVKRLFKEYGATCLTEGHVIYAPKPGAARELDQRVTAARATDESWVEDGKVWLGSRERAAEAFGATTLYVDKDSAWVFMVVDKVPRARELHAWRSENGKVAWTLRQQIAPCISENPEDD